MSVDVEDYFMVEAFAGRVARSTWKTWPSRVVANTRRTLDLFEKYNVKATFFFVGWVAERFPEIVRDVHARGHELACHSFWHRTVSSLTPREFREDTRVAVRAIEDAASVKVKGYRAPSWSITKDCLWALDILAEEDFAYDSSIYPIHHDLYGVPGAQRFPYTHACSNGRILREFPPATARLLGQNLPGAGGGYLRIFPLPYTRWIFCRFEENYRQRVIVYFHPWELDPEQPRIRANLKSRLRHYTGLKRTERRLNTLLQSYRFQPFRDLLDAGGSAEQALNRAPREITSVNQGTEGAQKPIQVASSSLGRNDIPDFLRESRCVQWGAPNVLTYHAISPQRSSSIYTLSRGQLEEHLKVVADLARSGSDRRSPSVTFDDGYLSNFELALPLLERYSTAATFFVVASFVNCRADFMTWSHLKEIAMLGHEIQSHTWSHPLLTNCSDDELREELVRSRQTIEQRLGKSVEALGIPGGRWNARVLRAAAKAGYRRVYVSDPWAASPQREGVEVVGRLTVKSSMQRERLRSLLTGQGMYPVVFRAHYRAKELFRQAVGDTVYQRVWSSILAGRDASTKDLAENPSGRF